MPELGDFFVERTDLLVARRSLLGVLLLECRDRVGLLRVQCFDSRYRLLVGVLHALQFQPRVLQTRQLELLGGKLNESKRNKQISCIIKFKTKCSLSKFKYAFTSKRDDNKN